MYIYLKAKPKKPPRKIPKILSTAFLVLGLVILGQAVLPVAFWYFFNMPEISGKIISPLASTFPPLVAAAEVDSYKPANWFATAVPVSQNNQLKTYTLTISKLDIDAATVEFGGDLKKSLVAWPTSPPPGTYGNNIIFGHSELPQFSNSKSYSGIFTFLMNLNKGDEIFVDYDGVRYKYVVVDKKVVDPTDLSVLEQRFDAGYLTLITCVPPGTLWKRGIIKAKLASL
ncbi:sortase [Candidatus Gottesmanbacteria bacterium]|nr:sortase [Candidatus Gottesmanbacteria bacterium]